MRHVSLKTISLYDKRIEKGRKEEGEISEARKEQGYAYYSEREKKNTEEGRKKSRDRHPAACLPPVKISSSPLASSIIKIPP